MNEQLSKKINRILLFVIPVAVVIYLSYIFFDIIIMLIISILAAMIFNPLVTFMEKYSIPRFLCVLIVFAVTGVVLFIGLSFLIPKITNQMNAIADTLTRENINTYIAKIQSWLRAHIPFINSKEFVQQLSTLISNMFFNSINNLSYILSSIFSIVTIMVIVPFMTFFLLKDNKRLVKGIINIMPNKYFEVSYWVLRKINIELSRFVRGWILDAFIVGTLSAIGLKILGIDNAISIGFIAGVGHLIPYFGPIIGGIPAILISVVQFGDFSRLPNIVLMFLLIYTIDNGFIQPNVFSKSTDIHPMLIIILIIVGSQLMGVLGMLIAVPTATVIKTAAKEIYNGYKNYKIIRA